MFNFQDNGCETANYLKQEKSYRSIVSITRIIMDVRQKSEPLAVRYHETREGIIYSRMVN